MTTTTVATTTPLQQLFESPASASFFRPHEEFVNANLVELNDGSFVSCSDDKTAKRWLRTGGNSNDVQLLGTYKGHTNIVYCAMERDDNTLLTGSFDRTMKVWNTTSCECLSTLRMRSQVWSLMKTKDKTRFVCGLYSGRVEVRRVNDLGVISSFMIHDEQVRSPCELEDGSFVSAAYKTMKRWDDKGTVLQTFSGHSNAIERVIELKRDVIVSASYDKTVKIWRVSTGEALYTLTLRSEVCGLEKVMDGVLVAGSYRDKMIVVLDEKGNIIETHQSGGWITAMTRLRDGSIVTANSYLIEIRRL